MAETASSPPNNSSDQKARNAQLADVAEYAFAVGGHQQAAEAVLRPDVADDHTGDDLGGLDLPPTRGALAGQVTAGEVLGHHALMPLPHDLLEPQRACGACRIIYR